MENVFKRHEIKFMLNQEQFAEIKCVLSKHMTADSYDNYLVQNMYFDTDNWDVIRTSIEKPVYKEKLRLRCYGIPQRDTLMFLELKKKFKGIVYKRRIAFPMEEIFEKAKSLHTIIAEDTSQIGRELAFYIRTHPVYERAYIAYQRLAFSGEAGFRVTFDTDAYFSLHSIGCENPAAGQPIFPEDMILMEVKTAGGIPLWLTQMLSEKKIHPISFSKYGVGYTKYILGDVSQWTSSSVA